MATKTKDTFKIVKAKSLDESDEACIDITCRLCNKTVNFAGTFENVRAKRNDFVDNHSCNTAAMIATNQQALEAVKADFILLRGVCV